MEHDSNIEYALQLYLENLDELEHQQKGKQMAGKLTDLELAITFMQNDLLAAQVSIQDHVLAVSTSTAIATDQNILMSIRQEEIIAQRDHQLARGLDGDEHVNFDNVNESEQEFDNTDAISTVMGDLMERMTLASKEDDGGASSCSAQTHRAVIQCGSCLEDKEAFYRSSCGHEYCHDCTRQLFLGAIKDEELYPPRCCGRVIPPGITLRILAYHELRAFSERAIEYSSKDRVYCAEPTCSKFIPPFAVRDEHGTCPECQQRTHLPCRALAHPGVDCPLDNTLQNVLAMANTENWMRCFNCRTLVELQHGCNHITCRCGREFCYICGNVWRSCNCPLWHENRLVEMANEAVDEEVEPNADAGVRQGLFNRIVENLRRHEEVGCEHHRSSQWRWRNQGSLQCEVCDYVLPEYIFMCTNCRMRACNRCKRHRLR
ncbi:hypothetical protein BGW36DRAFT_299454 [Talaromyces proteolyticus]|uniref:RBR-type E3 ubiquitin transferase n=1 Tax=Talaromyces proteolyticus TaxID=1131652 RepID=A0AAD4KM51_9EURO|nr:uncharacterized protein BGW36DRAFT_299454 [Talaromyces proteolyticus]KAH8695674.1 hypothetical protein BGW36DRAFT_299454 [Talaromyces proteolyticus]